MNCFCFHCCLLMFLLAVIAILFTVFTCFWSLGERATPNATLFLINWNRTSTTTITPNIITNNQSFTLDELRSVLNSTLNNSHQALLIDFQKIAQMAVDSVVPKLKQDISLVINNILTQKKALKSDLRESNTNIENVTNQLKTQENSKESAINMVENENVDLEYGFGIIRGDQLDKRKHKTLDMRTILNYHETLINELKETNSKVEQLENQNLELQNQLRELQDQNQFNVEENHNRNIQGMHRSQHEVDEDDMDDPTPGLVLIKADRRGVLKYDTKTLIFI